MNASILEKLSKEIRYASSVCSADELVKVLITNAIACISQSPKETKSFLYNVALETLTVSNKILILDGME